MNRIVTYLIDRNVSGTVTDSRQTTNGKLLLLYPAYSTWDRQTRAGAYPSVVMPDRCFSVVGASAGASVHGTRRVRSFLGEQTQGTSYEVGTKRAKEVSVGIEEKECRTLHHGAGPYQTVPLGQFPPDVSASNFDLPPHAPNSVV